MPSTRQLTNLAIALSSALAVSGCALHPLPKDFSRDATVSIVKKIRCETFEALKGQILSELRSYDRFQHPGAWEIALAIEENRFSIKEAAKDPRVPRPARGHFENYRKTEIGYLFEFTMTETNNNGGGIGFNLPFTNGSLLAGTNLDKNLERKNIRKFKVAEEFGELAESGECIYGDVEVAEHKNVKYPITGKVGMEEVIETFINLSRIGHSNKTALRMPGKTAGEFSEELTFTTTLQAASTASVSISAIPQNQFRLAKADLSQTSKRVDAHKLTVSLKLPGNFNPARKSIIDRLNKIESRRLLEDLANSVK